MSNLAAFLKMITISEGTAKFPNPYAVTFGGVFTITNFADHPAVLGWKGFPIDFLGPQYLGEESTAAGAYQIIKATWIACKTALRLPDFSPASQDAAATLLIRQRGALALIEGGQMVEAVNKCRTIWASLPGSTSGQPQQKLGDLVRAYVNSGGAFV